MMNRRIMIALGILIFVPRAAVALEFVEVETKHFTIGFGRAPSTAEMHEVTEAFEAAYHNMETVLGGAGTRPIDVVIFGETGDFTAETSLPVWSASATIDGAIYMQPVSVLKARGALDTAIAHEVCLVFLGRRYGDGMPAWLAEGLAVYHSGEIETLKKGITGARPPVAEASDIDALLLDRADRQKNRWGYILAYEAVRAMIEGGSRAQARKRGAP